MNFYICFYYALQTRIFEAFCYLACLGFFYQFFFSFSENSGVFVAGQSFSGEEYVCLLGTALGRRAFCKRPPSVNDVLLNHPIIALGMWEVASCLCSSCSLCSLGLLGAYPRSCTVGSGFSVSPAWTKKGRPVWSSCCLSLLFQVQKKNLLRLPHLKCWVLWAALFCFKHFWVHSRLLKAKFYCKAFHCLPWCFYYLLVGDEISSCMAGIVLVFSNHWLKNKSGWKDFLVLNSVGFLSHKRSSILWIART